MFGGRATQRRGGGAVVFRLVVCFLVPCFGGTTRPADGIRTLKRFSYRLGLMKQFLLKIFTWGNGETFGTQLWTWRFGGLVGQDEQGNRYYRTKGGKVDTSLGFEGRWGDVNGHARGTWGPRSW